MWGDPRSSNRMDPFRRSQDERFASGWNRDFLARSDGLALERNAGVFQSGRDPYRPLELSGMLGPSGRQFASREATPFSFATRGLPIDFRGGDRMAQELQIRDLQARELASLDFRMRDPMTSEFRGREMHPMDYRIREELMMEYRERDGAAPDFRNRLLPPLQFKDRGVPHVDYRERELLGDFRSREAPPDIRGRDMLDIDFRSKEQSYTELRETNVSDIDFRNRNQLLSDYRGKDGPHPEFQGNSSSPLDFRGKEGSQLEFRARDLPHSDFKAPGSSDLDMRGRDTTMFNFQSIERPGADQDFRERNVVETTADIPDRVRLLPNQQLVDYMQSQPTVRTPERELHEDSLNKTGDPALGRSLYGEEQQTNNQAQDNQSCELPPDSKNSDGHHNINTAEDASAESARQPLSSGQQLQTPPGRGVKRGVDLDFLGRQDTDYRNMDYRDVDLRFDYGHGKAHIQERPAKEPRPDPQVGKSGRSAAKSSKIGESSDSHARSTKEEEGAKVSEDFDEFVQRVSTAVNAALDSKNTKVTDVDKDYRHAASGEECTSRFIQIHGLPADIDKKEVIEAIRSPDGKPIEDLQLSDFNPGGVISVRSPPKEVWICGHSLVQCAKERARRLPQGTQLGISCHKAKITWMGEAGMKWDQLIPTMREMVGKSPAPDLIVVHLGENDLMQMTGVDLIIRIKRDLRYLMTLFPRAHIMWSSLLPRRVWLGAKKPAAIDRTRKEINREVKLFCRQVGMLQLQHDAIRFESPHQFSSDGEQLSEIGLEVFTVDLQASIQGWLNVR